MAIKLKKLLINNPFLKFLSLFILFMSLSILFEACFYKYHDYSDLIIRKNLFFISISISILSIIVYIFNRKSEIKLISSSIKLINLTSYFEVIILCILFLYIIRDYINVRTRVFYSSDLIIIDCVIAWTIYIAFISIYYREYNTKPRFISIKLIKNFISKSKRNTLIKKISLIFALAALIQSIFIFIAMILFYAHPIYALTRTIYLSLISIVCYSYIYKKIEEKIDYIEYLERNIKNIENGDLKYKLDIIGNDELASIATSVNNIGEGLDKALESQLKNEKMKTELITNVSHDLKTPLTSIISYIDILKNNELDKQTTNDYLSILDKKSQRLKNLVDDIFEASKISSGDIELHFEKTDIKELLIQSIVELDDKIESSKLDFVINTPNEPIFTNIDGKRMFRVFDNLISNIVKYSLPNTRVYVDVYTDCGYVLITMKNISNHKLNISPDELLERFVRGDVSRNTNGSGLGLSIANNLVDMQGGKLELDIDGDLFKVKLKFRILQNLNECKA